MARQLAALPIKVIITVLLLSCGLNTVYIFITGPQVVGLYQIETTFSEVAKKFV